MPPDPTLGVLTSFRASPRPDGRFVLTKKLIEGLEGYIERWNGRVKAFVELSDADGGDLDKVVVHPDDLPFELEAVHFDDDAIAERLAECGVVSASIVHQTDHLGALCESLDIPLVYVSELSLPTRLQIIEAAPLNPVVKVRRAMWAVQQEWRQIDAIGRAAGIQCNGTPTFDAYEELTDEPLLFFDTRVRHTEQIEPDALERRLASAPDRLRLVFSGRLDHIKGTDDLVRVANGLRRAGVPFRLDIFGAGPLEARMQREIARLGLEAHVFLRGAVDFHDELLPALKAEADLFVCGHRQGDPSCTYLETLGCGVPIVGYDNEALAGILARADVGDVVPTNDVDALVERIVAVNSERGLLARWSRNAIAFARRHAFEDTMDRRIDHLRRIAASRHAAHHRAPLRQRVRSLADAAATSVEHYHPDGLEA